MHLGALLPQGVDRPAPAPASPRARPAGICRPGPSPWPPLRVVADPDALQRITVGGHPDDHRSSPVQIDSHELPTGIGFAHRGLLRRTDVSTASLNPLAESHEERGPAPSSHQSMFWGRLSTPSFSFTPKRSGVRNPDRPPRLRRSEAIRMIIRMATGLSRPHPAHTSRLPRPERA